MEGLGLTGYFEKDAVISGVASFGDTPVSEVVETLGNQADDQSAGFDTGGVLTPAIRPFTPWPKGGHDTCWSIGRC